LRTDGAIWESGGCVVYDAGGGARRCPPPGIRPDVLRSASKPKRCQPQCWRTSTRRSRGRPCRVARPDRHADVSNLPDATREVNWVGNGEAADELMNA